MSKKQTKSKTVAAPAATGGAGPQFEGKVGAFYLLSLLSSSEPRGLPGASIQTVAFQQRGSGFPLDDVIIQAINADGSPAILEIQAKRTLTFTASDAEFADVVTQMWKAAQKSAFDNERYELAVAIARTSTRIERSCQEVLHWARQLPDGETFIAHINREGFSSEGMRDFVDVFGDNLKAARAPTDATTVWRLLRRFQILVFDFESIGSDYEHRARERARLALVNEQASRAADLWPVLIEHAGACARAGGTRDRATVVRHLQKQHGFRFDQRADLRVVGDRLAEAALQALDEIRDSVGGVRLNRTELIDQADLALESHRILQIVGAPGVGKSSVLKHLALQIQQEGRIIVLRNGRVVPGGWLQFAHTLNCAVSREELFNELGCNGGATLFIDNIDQIIDPGAWATVMDLLVGVVRNPGWRAVVTGSIESNDWQTRLPAEVGTGGIATLQVGEISDAETVLLSEGNQSLAFILNDEHPARGVARNLFYLSRILEIGAGQPNSAAPGITTEMDLARLWWRHGGGRGNDNGRLARLKVLRAMGTQVLAEPSCALFKADEFDSSTIAELLQHDSLREETRGATVTFRHDVLRDWTVGFMLHEDEALLGSLSMDVSLPPGLARGLEVAARLALDSDATGARWTAILATIERKGGHGSWRRPVLLALPRAEQAAALLQTLQLSLLENDGQLLSEIIRLVIAVESEPIDRFIRRVAPGATIPSAPSGISVPKGSGWTWLTLTLWLASNSDSLPSALVPDTSKMFQAWLISTQNWPLPTNKKLVGVLFDWLAMIEDAMSPRIVHDIREAPPTLNIPHLRNVCDDIRLTTFAFAHLNPDAAKRYLSNLDPRAVRHHEMHAILGSPGALPKAAPAALVDFALGALIDEEDPTDRYDSRCDRYGPFEVDNYLFSPASPGQPPFFEILKNAPAEGLRLVRGVVEHATQWRRNRYIEAGKPFPRISVPFSDGTKSFEGDWSVYHWPRSEVPSAITTSALMALEAWGHSQIDAGRPVEEVLHEVLGPDGSSVAFVAVAVDLVLSHWRKAYPVAWPLVATPELLEFDDVRKTRDIAGTGRLLPFQQESSAWPVKRSDLDGRASRRSSLSDRIGYYVFHAEPQYLPALKAALERACNEICQSPEEGNENPIKGLRAVARRALRMTNAEHWTLVRITLNDGSEREAPQFQPDVDEQKLVDAAVASAKADVVNLNTRIKIQQALLEREKSTPEIVAEGIEWAKLQSTEAVSEASESDGEASFDKEWNRRAVIMAAALAARDYNQSDRSDILDWALPLLQNAAIEESNDYYGNERIEYNKVAIAAFGLAALYLRDQETSAHDALLRIASDPHPAVLDALGRHFQAFNQFNPRLLRSLIRIAIVGSVHPYRAEDADQKLARQNAHQARITAAIEAERRWLAKEEASEPSWPELPVWHSRPRRGIRIGGGDDADDNDLDEEMPSYYVDERFLGELTGHLIRLTVGDLPHWVVELAKHLMTWTDQANGPHGADDYDRNNRPHTWNTNFFDFVGILCVALPHDEVVATFLKPITRFKDEAFHDATADFLSGFDRATLATDTAEPENPFAVRELLADRIRQGRNFRRLRQEKGFTSETHAATALNAIFYQLPNFASRGRPNIPDNWTGLDATIPTLTSLVTDAPSSGYLAIVFLNVVETSPRAALLPFVVQASVGWCSAYGIDTNFWVDRGIGGRVCAWLERAIANDKAAIAVVLPTAKSDLMRCLDILIRSGVVHAREVEDMIVASDMAGDAATV